MRSAGVDHPGAGGSGQPRAHRGDAVALDQDIRPLERRWRARQDLTAANQQSHGCLLRDRLRSFTLTIL